MKRTRRNHGAAFKAQVAFAACKGDKTLAELATQLSCIPPRSRNGSSTCWRAPLTCVAARSLRRTRRIDELHLASPFAGARMLRDLLRREGHRIGRKRVRTVMARMDIAALYRKPTTSQRHPAHRVYPYLCSVIWRSPDPTRSGRLISRMFR
jgi:hypothetical protein